MSRLGDLIRTERIRQNMTPKQVAKKCGFSESYIVAVENGTRIIPDDQARRILKSIGLKQQTEADFSLYEDRSSDSQVSHQCPSAEHRDVSWWAEFLLSESAEQLPEIQF